MRLSKEDVDAKIVELYKRGYSFRQLQKKYRKSPNYIAKLVKGIEVKCAACGKPKGKVRFHAHHPDRVNYPDYTIPLCPSCHAKEEAKLRRERENQAQPLALVNKSSTTSTITENAVSQSKPPSLSLPPAPLSPAVKKVVIGVVTAAIVDTWFPSFFPNLINSLQNGNEYYQEKKRRWRGKTWNF